MGHPHYSRLQKGGKRQLSHSPPTGKTGAVEGLFFPNRAKEGQMAAFCLGDFTEKSKIRLFFWGKRQLSFPPFCRHATLFAATGDTGFADRARLASARPLRQIEHFET